MRIFRSLVMVGLLVAGLAARAEYVDGIRAIVHDSPITHVDIEGRMIQAADLLQRQYSGQPETLQKKLMEAERDSLEQLVAKHLILQEFKGFNVPETILDKDVDKRVEDQIREQYYGDRMRLIKTLQAQGLTFEKYRQQIREQFIELALRQRNVSSAVIISPHKVETYYLAHKDEYKVEEEVKLRMIVLTNSVDPNAPQAQKLAEELVVKLKEGADFAELARIYSQGSQRKEGGDWGWIERTKLRKELADVAETLKPGQQSAVIETQSPQIFYIMLLEDKRPAHFKSLGEVRNEIEKNLELEEKARLQKQWIDRLRKKTFVRYYY